MKLASVLILHLLWAAVAVAADKPAHTLVEEANRLLDQGQYDEALARYKAAEQQLPDAPEIAYNQAVAHYRKGEFDKARELFLSSLRTLDPKLDANAKFNLGNASYAQALQNASDSQAAIDSLKNAMLHYKDAIEADPTDLDARANIEMAQLLLKQLLEQQQQQQQQQQNEQSDQQDQEQQDQQPQQQQQNEQQQQDSEQEQQSDDSQEQQSQENQQQQQNESPQDNEPQDEQSQNQQQQEQSAREEPQQQEAKPESKRQMTEEEAQRLLQRIRDKELERRRELARRQRLKLKPVDKDW